MADTIDPDILSKPEYGTLASLLNTHANGIATISFGAAHIIEHLETTPAVYIAEDFAGNKRDQMRAAYLKIKAEMEHAIVATDSLLNEINRRAPME